MNPFASIIIPTCNRPDHLLRCLQALEAQLPQDQSVDLHVCDDGAAKDTEEILARKFPNVCHHPGPRRGPGANRNAGARSAQGGWLVFLDDDVIPQPGMLAAYLQAMRGTADGILAGPIFRTDAMRSAMLWEAPLSGSTSELPPSCNFAIPRKAFLESGGFDERYEISFEDMEFFSRLKAGGTPYLFLEGAAVEHPSRPVPSSRKLAMRWKARVLSSYDFGATTGQVLRLLPRHILLVILSRFRGRKLSAESFRAAIRYLGEFLFALAFLPAWVAEYRNQPRSKFWRAQEETGKIPRNFGL